ncbi:sulfatase [bacterium]|nr:sulfatase [bacterium]
MKIVARSLLCLFATVVTASTLFAADRPNIVFLLSDDQCTFSMGCYGNKDVQTPNLDQLAAEGMIFDNHYDTTAICMASRANIMTGMYEYKTGCNFTKGDMLHDHWQKSYPMLLRKAGYRTAMAGKIGFTVEPVSGSGRSILPSGDFDTWGAGPGQTNYATKRNKSIAKYAKEYPHSTVAYGAFGRDFIAESVKTDKPFCLSISFKAPHMPATPDKQFDHVYAGKTFYRPDNYGRAFGKHFSKQSQQGRQYARWSDWSYDKAYDKVMAKYNQQCYAIDYAVGMVREALKANGVADNTVIIYTSDNGFLCGSHGYGSKVLPYEESTRVPLIMFDPRHKNSGKQLRCRSLTGNIDFAPTILKLAGLDVPKSMDGRSLLSLYDDPNANIHQSLALMNVWGPKAVHSLAVVTKDWKYIYWPYAAKGFEPTEEVYHTAADPLELKNLRNESAALASMRLVYDQTVSHWKANAMNSHGYSDYGTVFDRAASWGEKESLMK